MLPFKLLNWRRSMRANDVKNIVMKIDIPNQFPILQACCAIKTSGSMPGGKRKDEALMMLMQQNFR